MKSVVSSSAASDHAGAMGSDMESDIIRHCTGYTSGHTRGARHRDRVS